MVEWGVVGQNLKRLAVIRWTTIPGTGRPEGGDTGKDGWWPDPHTRVGVGREMRGIWENLREFIPIQSHFPTERGLWVGSDTPTVAYSVFKIRNRGFPTEVISLSFSGSTLDSHTKCGINYTWNYVGGYYTPESRQEIHKSLLQCWTTASYQNTGWCEKTGFE